MAARIFLIAASRPAKIASPTRKLPDVQFDDLRQRRDQARRVVIDPMAGVALDAELFRVVLQSLTAG
jgi:hypothetical protein